MTRPRFVNALIAALGFKTKVIKDPFERQLTLVKTTIESRVKGAPQAKQDQLRTRLWIHWINATLLTPTRAKVEVKP